jgi:hypothetical protein
LKKKLSKSNGQNLAGNKKKAEQKGESKKTFDY